MTTTDEHPKMTRADGEHPVKRIEQDHLTLRGQLDAIAAATSHTILLDHLLDLPKGLREHFELEEQIDGLYDDLQARCPAVAPQLEILRAEHQLILDEFDSVYARLQQRMDTEQTGEESTRPITRDIARWLERLRRHEREESRLIGDVYYTDEGGCG